MVNRAVNDARRENDRTKTCACNSCKIPLMPEHAWSIDTVLFKFTLFPSTELT